MKLLTLAFLVLFLCVGSVSAVGCVAADVLSLMSPVGNSTLNANTTANFTVQVNCSVSGLVTLANATLFGNFTGSWAGNASNTTAITGVAAANYTFFNVPINFTNGYVWNVKVCDSTTNACQFATVNSTFVNNRSWIPIIFNAPTPVNNSNFTSPFLYINATVNASNVNSSAFVDLGRSLLLYCPFDFTNSTGVVFSNASYGGFLYNPALGNNQTVGIRGNAIDLRGNSGDRYVLNISRVTGFNPASNFTMCIWVRNQAAGVSSQRYWGYNFNETDKAELMWRSTNIFVLTAIKGNQSYNFSTSGAPALLNNTWYQTCVTWNGSNGGVTGGNYSLYVDGNRQSTQTASGAMPPIGSTNFSWGGATSPTGGITLGDGLHAQMDDALFFNRSLSPSEINMTRNASVYGVSFNYSSGDFPNVTNTQMTYKIYADDAAGSFNSTDTFLYTYDVNAVTINVTGISPANNTNVSIGTIAFIANVSFQNSNISNVSIWGTFCANGVYCFNQSNSSIWNDSNVNYTFNLGLTSGTYIVNYLVCPSTGQACVRSQNYSYGVTPIFINATNLVPVNNTNITIGITTFTVNVSFANTNISNVSLYGSFGGPWNFNQSNATIVNGSPSNWLFNVSLAAGNYTFAYRVCPTVGGQPCTFTVNYTLNVSSNIINGINVTLLYPGVDRFVFNSTNFTAIAITMGASGLKNATLWTNITGNWTANVTNTTGISNNSIYVFFNYSVTLINYTVWNMYVCDNNDFCAFAPVNGTMFIIITPTANDPYKELPIIVIIAAPLAYMTATFFRKKRD